MAKATYNIYKLHFTAPLHIADTHEEEGYSLKTIQSDTLYAALMSCLAKTGASLPDNGELGLTVSSLFPFFQRGKEDDPIYFLPIPMQANSLELSDVAMAKKVKRLQWIDSEIYSDFLLGKNPFDGSADYYPYIQDSYLSKSTLPEDSNGSREFVRSEVSQRVTLQSRTEGEDAKPYYLDKIIFKYESGMYFLAKGDIQLLEKALGMLSNEGIGTDRNVGFGYFDYSSDCLQLDIPDDADHQMALSILIPESQEQLDELLASDKVAYDFIRRGGWITTYPYTTLRKNAIYGFLPGSVLSKSSCMNDIIGKIVNLKPEIGDLTPDHPIWRNGKAIMLPVNLKQ